MTFCAKTDQGKVRNNNQDSFFADYLPPIGKLCGNAFLAVVCDGMGGVAGGQIASSLAIESFVQRLQNKLNAYAECSLSLKDIPFISLMEDAAQYANSKVYSKSRKDPDLQGMGTTLVACLIVKETIYIVNVGDSRLYASMGTAIKQITVDHSYVQSLVEMGSISQSDAENHPDKNIITRAIGTKSTVNVDKFILSDYVDSLLLCSDGLSNMISSGKMLDIVCSAQNVTIAVDTMIKSANKNGGTDNITVVLIKL